MIDIRVLGDNTEEMEALLSQPSTPLLPLEDSTPEALDEAFPELTPKQKQYFLQELGFICYHDNEWHHPGLGPNTMFDRITFDINTEKLDVLVFKIFTFAFGKGQFEIRHNLKRLLDIR